MNSPIAREELEQSLGAAGPALALPPATFTSPQFYEFELDAIWGREWFCVGRASEVPNRGDYYTIRVGHEPLIVVRRDQDEIAVLSAVCQHRGMILADGSGNARRFRCPYHEWVYGLDGRLLVAPDMADDPDFDPSTICLPRIRSEIWEGFVFACFDPVAPALAGRLQRLGERLAGYRLSELKSAEPLQMVPYEWNWKIFGDECYHCSHLHAHTWHEWYPTSTDLVDAESDLNQPELGIIAYELHGELDAAPTRSGKCVHQPLPQLTDAERSRLAYVTVAPNLLIIAMPDKVKYFLWMPTGPTSSTFGAVWMFPDSTLSDPGFKERWTQERDDLAPVMDEDVWAWGSVQAGMFSRFAPRSRYAPTEAVIARLNRWLAERYIAADGATADAREPAAVR